MSEQDRMGVIRARQRVLERRQGKGTVRVTPAEVHAIRARFVDAAKLGAAQIALVAGELAAQYGLTLKRVDAIGRRIWPPLLDARERRSIDRCIEDRTCARCAAPFRVGRTSPKRFCGHTCAGFASMERP